MTDNRAGADLGGTTDGSPTRASKGAFGDLTSSVESDDFVDSILMAAEQEVLADRTDRTDDPTVPKAATPATGAETSATVAAERARTQATPAPRRHAEPASRAEATRGEARQPTQAQRADMQHRQPKPDTPTETRQGESVRQPRAAESTAAIQATPRRDLDLDLSGEPQQIAVPGKPSRRVQGSGSPLQAMIANEPKFVFAAGLLIALGLICVIAGLVIVR